MLSQTLLNFFLILGRFIHIVFGELTSMVDSIETKIKLYLCLGPWDFLPDFAAFVFPGSFSG